MWHCWISAGLSEGAFIIKSQSSIILFFFAPVKPTVLSPICFEYSNAFIMFSLLPEVEIAKIISFSVYNPSICFENIFSYPKSLAIAVITDTFEESEIAGRAFLSFLNLPMSN